MTAPLFDTPVSQFRGAVMSEDGRYRYLLTRRWTTGDTTATFVMLNPSTADAEQDDPTIRRCLGYAHSWGCAALTVLNLYALRSTDPRALWTAADPVGPENDAFLRRHAGWARKYGWPLIAAWGVNARPDRVAAVLALPGMDVLQALGVTRSGAPRHPLYMPTSAVPAAWPPAHLPAGETTP